MQMAMVGGTVGISLPVEPGIDYSRYIDAKVRVQANAAPLFNLVNQIMGVTLLAPGASSVKILQPPPADPFQLPVLLIDQLLRWDHLAEQRHRVHTRDRVTLLWPAVSSVYRIQAAESARRPPRMRIWPSAMLLTWSDLSML